MQLVEREVCAGDVGALKFEIWQVSQTNLLLYFWKGLSLCSVSSKSQTSEVRCGTVFLHAGHRAERLANSLPELPGFSFPKELQIKQLCEIRGPMNHSASLISLTCVMC